jgi:hypothetical protein
VKNLIITIAFILIPTALSFTVKALILEGYEAEYNAHLAIFSALISFGLFIIGFVMHKQEQEDAETEQRMKAFERSGWRQSIFYKNN